ncbi:protein of unknown function [Aminobacter niigataensis]|nr:protein of unknown function [Aminobacter niigataensis]
MLSDGTVSAQFEIVPDRWAVGHGFHSFALSASSTSDCVMPIRSAGRAMS